MTTTDPLSSLYANPTAMQPAAGKSSVSQDQFLKLFVAQLEHQSPLDPQDGSAMVAQLAQFSSLEQQVQSNTHLADLTSAQDAATSASLAGLVGHTSTVDASTLTLDGPPPPIDVHTDGQITGGTVVIKNASGQIVNSIPLPAGNGTIPVAWNGTDQRGVAVPPGTYTIEVEATGAGGATVHATPELKGVIDGLELGPTGNHLRIGHALITPSAVLSIGASGAHQ
jgi:flagellar basal-body rod modification protein FlgD